MQHGFFDVTPEDLGLLDSALAVDVLREMVWAEVHNIGIPITETDIPFSITSADGGIDAEVSVAPKTLGNGLIFAPKTFYQVKTGKFALTASSDALIEKLLLKPAAIEVRKQRDKAAAKKKKAVARKKPPSKIATIKNVSGKDYTVDDINPRVRQCLDEDATFVILLFGSDSTEIKDKATVKAIITFLSEIDTKYARAKVKVWRQSVICGLVRQFPPLSLKIKKLPSFSLLRFEEWSQMVDMSPTYRLSEANSKVRNELREAMRTQGGGFTHIRMTAEPGIGKTRLVLEALRAPDLAGLTLYAAKASKLDAIVTAAIRSVKNANIILVVDECGPAKRAEIVQEFEGQHHRLKIISIYPDQDNGDYAAPFRVASVPPLPDSEIEAIIQSYLLDAVVARKWAKLCQGSPRVAHIVGPNLKADPENPLKDDGIAGLWVRYLAGNTLVGTREYIRRHIVASSLALFKHFGWSRLVRSDAKEVYEQIVKVIDPWMSYADFLAIVQALIARKVFQGDHYLYITPKALHLRLWIDWWEKYQAIVDINMVLPLLSDQMRKWFGEMIAYGISLPETRKLVSDWLGPDGLYKDTEWLKTKSGSRFFFSLALADPNGAVAAIERTIGQMPRADLLSFAEGRREVIGVLERTAVHGHLFKQSARLMMKLADAENENWSNNATGTFTSLFALGYGRVASTSLEPNERLSVLTEAIEVGGNYAKIALDAFDKSLSTYFSRMVSDDDRPLAEPVKRWTPKTYGELVEAYKLYWTTLRCLLQKLSGIERRRAASILLSNIRAMLSIEPMQLQVIETLQELIRLAVLDKRDVIEHLTDIMRYDGAGLPENIRNTLSAANTDLTGIDYPSRLRRFVGMDFLEDKIDKQGNAIDPVGPKIVDLATQSLADQSAFIGQLPWLVTVEARNGFRFGFQLAKSDAYRVLWPVIENEFLKFAEGTNDYFLGGYLTAVFERSAHEWQALIFKLARKLPQQGILPSLVWRSGMTDEVAEYLVKELQDGTIGPAKLMHFSIGRASAKIPDRLFNQWLDTLINLGTFDSMKTAVNLAAMSIYDGRGLDASVLQRIIGHDALFGRKGQYDAMLSHYWLVLAKELVKKQSQKYSVVLQILLDNFDSSGLKMGPEGEKYLDELVSLHPEETWAIIGDQIAPPLSSKGFAIMNWFRGDMGFSSSEPGSMRHIPRKAIWDWIELDKEKRTTVIAHMAPKDFEPHSWGGSLVRELLVHFGDSKNVRSSIYNNFFTGGFSGPASAHYSDVLDRLKSLLGGEKDINAKRWLRDAIESTSNTLEQAQIQQAARGH